LRNYKELVVWQKGKNFAAQIYRATEVFPRAERFGLTSQIRRSATSVPANIAEGWGRGSTGEYVQFLLIARGSLMEMETHLIIAADLAYLKPEELESFQRQIEGIGQMLNRLIQALKNRQTKRKLEREGSSLRNPKPESLTPMSDTHER